jgi:hypothetical protein
MGVSAAGAGVAAGGLRTAGKSVEVGAIAVEVS